MLDGFILCCTNTCTVSVTICISFFVATQDNREYLSTICGRFNKAIIIPLVLVEYEMIIANSALCALFMVIYCLIFKACFWN